MLVVLIVNLAYGGRNNMKNNTNYKRRRDDVKISMIPRWMDITMIVCKWLIEIGRAHV